MGVSASEQTNVGCPCRIVSYTVPANLYADSSSNKPSVYRRLCVDMSVGREAQVLAPLSLRLRDLIARALCEPLRPRLRLASAIRNVQRGQMLVRQMDRAALARAVPGRESLRLRCQVALRLGRVVRLRLRCVAVLLRRIVALRLRRVALLLRREVALRRWRCWRRMRRAPRARRRVHRRLREARGGRVA